MTFRLERKSANHAVVKFHITNAAGDIVGSVNVKPDEVSDLEKCWRNSPTAGAAATKQSTAAAAMAAALRKGPKLSRAGILRGC